MVAASGMAYRPLIDSEGGAIIPAEVSCFLRAKVNEGAGMGGEGAGQRFVYRKVVLERELLAVELLSAFSFPSFQSAAGRTNIIWVPYAYYPRDLSDL